MSLYNALFGSNAAADVILATLGLTKADVGRFRDCFIEHEEIGVYTRNGGGNRDCWHSDQPTADSEDCDCPGCVINYRLPKHPHYVRDVDDDFDCTYATIYFRFPPEFADGLKAMESGEAFDPGARWQALFDAMRAASEKVAK